MTSRVQIATDQLNFLKMRLKETARIAKQLYQTIVKNMVACNIVRQHLLMEETFVRNLNGPKIDLLATQLPDF